MQRHEGLAKAASRGPRGDNWQLAVSSPSRALVRLRAAVENGHAGPILITGESGAGKTWQARRLAALLPEQWRTIFVDVAAGVNALEFLRLIAHALGVSVPNRLGAARLAVQGILEDELRDGRRWLLVVDQAHRGSSAVWDEIQTISNRLGQPGGFAALLVMGQTELARALATRSFSAFASHLSLHLHLMPLDLDEARELLGYPGRQSEALEQGLEELHRDSRGNPGMLLRLANALPAFQPAETHRNQPRTLDPQKRFPIAPIARHEDSPSDDHEEPYLAPAVSEAYTATAEPAAPPLIPARPPLRDEEGLVEVGWEGDLENELQAGSVPSEPDLQVASKPTLDEESIEDRYAAIQAWAEWTQNQERVAGQGAGQDSAQSALPQASLGAAQTDSAGPPNRIGSVKSGESADPPSPADAAALVANAARSPAVPPAGIRAETQHEFAPYSHLFTRLRTKG
jgi:general secretion pathway protein A